MIFLAERSRWQRNLIAILAGACGVLAMPPLGFIPAMAVSLTIAVLLLDTCVDPCADEDAVPSLKHLLRKGFFCGWLWGFGYFVAGLWWLGSAFLVEAELFAWAMPFGVIGLPAVLAIFPACGFATARLFWSPGWGRILAFAAALSASEWLRGHLFSGFPWNLIGMTLGQNLWLMQGAALGGVYFLTLLAILALSAPATLFDTAETRASRRFGPSLAAASALLVLAVYGAWRIPAGPQPVVADVKLRLMQPNVPQDSKFNARNALSILNEYLRVSAGDNARDGIVRGVTHVIWPESAFPFILDQSPEAVAIIVSSLSPGTFLISGAARMSEPLPGEQVGQFYNSIAILNSTDGSVRWQYDKVHLVPFGEYIPGFLQPVVEAVGLRQFIDMPGGFEAANMRRTVDIPGIGKAIGAICYESIFSNAIQPQDGGGEDAKLIVNVTNDAWFGDLAGPHQHFAQGRLRTVEEGLPMARVANTGITAAIDPYGRILSSLPLGAKGHIDMLLPLPAPKTFFRMAGEWLFGLGLLFCALIAGACAGRQNLRRRIAHPA